MSKEKKPPPPPAKKICPYSTSEIADKICEMAGIILGYKLYPYQKEPACEIVYALLENKAEEITILFSRQVGKSTMLSGIAPAIMILFPELAKMFPDDTRFNRIDDHGTYRGFKQGVPIGIFAPIRQQAGIIFSRIRGALAREESEEVLNELKIQYISANGNQVKLTNGSSVVSLSASEQSKIEGNSFALIICDESQDIGDQKLLKCLSGATSMLLPDGRYTTLKRLVERERSVGTPHGFFDGSRVEYHDNGVQPVYRITTSNGRYLDATIWHKHLVYARGWKKTRMVDTKGLKIGWRVAVPEALPVFGAEGNHDRGFLLGFMLGDGCMRGAPVGIADLPTLKKLRRIARVQFGVSITVRPTSSPGMYEFNFSGGTQGKKNSNLFTAWLREIGVWGCKGKDKFIPNRGWSKEFLRGLVEGLVVTDGCVEWPSVKPVVSFANTSKRLVYRLQDILLRFGVHGVVYEGFFGHEGSRLPGLLESPLHYMYRLHIKGVEDLQRFFTEFSLVNKLEEIRQAKKTIQGKLGRRHKKYFPAGVRFVRVSGIRQIRARPTYCVTVPTKEHLFYAGGFLTGNSVHPMAAAWNGSIVKIGTPSIQKGDFYFAIQRNKNQELLGGRKKHFEYDYEHCQEFNSQYRLYVAQEKLRLGEESDEFRMSYKIQWLLERGMFIVQDALLKLAVTEENHKTFWQENPRSNFVHPLHSAIHSEWKREGDLVVGIDFGKANDSTVVTVLHVDWKVPLIKFSAMTVEEMVEYTAYQKCIIGWLEIYGDNYDSQFYEICDYLEKFPGVRRIVFDATGVGESVGDRLIGKYGDDVDMVPFKFSASTKSELFKLLAAEMNSRRITYPAGAQAQQRIEYRKFITQFLNLEKEYNEGGYMMCGHGEDKDAHDDLCSSLALGVWGTQTPADMGIETSEENIFLKR